MSDPLSLLCEDAWLAVLEYLDPEPRDLLNVGATCVFFQDLLESQRVSTRGAGQGACQLEEVIPLLLKWLPEETVLDLRLVCRRVTRAVDRLIAENARITPNYNVNLFPRLIPPIHMNTRWSLEESHEYRNFKIHRSSGIFRWFRVNSLAEIQEIIEKLNGGGNPTKFLHVIVPMAQEEDEYVQLDRQIMEAMNFWLNMFWNMNMGEVHERLRDLFEIIFQKQHIFLTKTIELIRIFPQHFKYVRIDATNLRSHQDFHKLFRTVVASLPNLHHLEMDFQRHMISHFREEETSLIPLPPSPKLKLISIKTYSLPEAFIRQIGAQYGGQLKKLGLDITKYTTIMLNRGNLRSDQLFHFPSLLELIVSLVDILPGILTSIGSIPQSRMNAPQLKSLRLDDWGRIKILDVNPLITMILLFPSIVHFVFMAIRNNIVTTPGIAMENLQKAKGRHHNLLSLILDHGIFQSNLPLRFFTGLCPNLEKIEVYDSPGVLRSPDPDLNLLLDRRFEDSRIWTDAPNLKVVKITDREGNLKGNYVCFRPALPME